MSNPSKPSPDLASTNPGSLETGPAPLLVPPLTCRPPGTNAPNMIKDAPQGHINSNVLKGNSNQVVPLSSFPGQFGSSHFPAWAQATPKIQFPATIPVQIPNHNLSMLPPHKPFPFYPSDKKNFSATSPSLYLPHPPTTSFSGKGGPSQPNLLPAHASQQPAGLHTKNVNIKPALSPRPMAPSPLTTYHIPMATAFAPSTVSTIPSAGTMSSPGTSFGVGATTAFASQVLQKKNEESRDVLEIASILTSLSDKTSKSIDKPHKHVRRRRTTAPPERDLLLKIFEVDGVLWPSREARQELAKQLHMTPRQVQVWFQNQRAKIKQKTQTNA